MLIFSILSLLCGFASVILCRTYYCIITILLTYIFAFIAYVRREDSKLNLVGIASTIVAIAIAAFLVISGIFTNAANEVKENIDSDLGQFYGVDPSTAYDSNLNDMLDNVMNGLY